MHGAQGPYSGTFSQKGLMYSIFTTPHTSNRLPQQRAHRSKQCGAKYLVALLKAADDSISGRLKVHHAHFILARAGRYESSLIAHVGNVSTCTLCMFTTQPSRCTFRRPFIWRH